MDFSFRTGLILEMPPSEWVEGVQALRAKYEPWRRRLPVEITVIGSSGVGPFAHGEDFQLATQKIDRLASTLQRMKVRFQGRTSFPGTQLFYFEPSDVSQFVTLQKAVLETGLRFTESAFPYKPHCTIVDFGGKLSVQASQELEAIAVPSEEITISSISFCQMSKESCQILHRSDFGH